MSTHRVIHKHKLDLVAQQVVELPLDAKVLSAQFQGDDLCLWESHRVEEPSPTAKRVVLIVGTGEIREIPRNASWVATVQSYPFVWHIYVADGDEEKP